MIKKLKAEHRGDNPLSTVLEGFMFCFLLCLSFYLFVLSKQRYWLIFNWRALISVTQDGFHVLGTFSVVLHTRTFGLKGAGKQKNVAQDECGRSDWIERCSTAIRLIFRNF